MILDSLSWLKRNLTFYNAQETIVVLIYTPCQLVAVVRQFTVRQPPLQIKEEESGRSFGSSTATVNTTRQNIRLLTINKRFKKTTWAFNVICRSVNPNRQSATNTCLSSYLVLFYLYREDSNSAPIVIIVVSRNSDNNNNNNGCASIKLLTATSAYIRQFNRTWLMNMWITS